MLAGCEVGPDFEKPAAPKTDGYAAEPPAATAATPGIAGGEAQRFQNGGDVAGAWWALFHSEALNALIAEALTNNPDLKAAQAALSSARENVLAQRGAYWPGVSAGFSASRQLQSGALAPVPDSNAFQYSLFTPEVSVSYVPDVFGLNRRTVESLAAQQDAARFQMLATYTTLTTNVAVTAIQQASTDAQIAAARALVDDSAKSLDILAYQRKKGYASDVDVAAQKSILAQAKALLPPLEKQAAQLHDLLATLTGHFPGEASPQTITLTSLVLPQEIPLSLPSDLVAQRPDVQQAEANLHAASAEIGIAVANRLPNIELSANAGSTALAINQVFAAGTGFWTVGAGLTAPIFDGGALLHRERGARAAYDQAAQQYRSTVLAAFQNVADTLAALQQDAEALKAAAAADDAAKRSRDLAGQQVKDGYSSALALFSAEQAYQQAEINLVQMQASRFADTAALYQALGGGWWHKPELTGDDHGA
jgi:NodT family efflux transporter outer membrane factor (OMF) lipoprotein